MKRFLLAIALALMSPLAVFAQCCPEYTAYGFCPASCYGGQCPGGGCQGGFCPMPQAEQTPDEATGAAYQNQYPAVVKVEFSHGRSADVGSGFIADRDQQLHIAVIVTCAHGYHAGDHVRVTTQAGQRYDAGILAMDKRLDAGILTIRDPGIAAMQLAADYPRPGEKLTQVGFSAGHGFMATVGQLSSYCEMLDKGHKNYMRTTLRTAQGCSGGPVLDSHGMVCGTVYAFTRPITRDSGDGMLAPCLPVTFHQIACKPLDSRVQTATAVEDLPAPAGVTPCASGQPLPGIETPWRRGVEGRLDEIASDIHGIQSAPSIPPAPIIVQTPPTASPPTYASGPDPQTMAAMQNLGNTVNQHGQAIEQLGKGLAQTNDTVGKIADNQAKHGTILERIEARREGIGQAVEDVKGDPALRQVLIVGGIVLAACVLIGLILWNILHGKGLVRQIADNIAANHPQNQVAQKAANFFDTHEDRLKDLLTKAPALAAVAAMPTPTTVAAAAGDAAQIASAVAADVKAHVTALLTPAPGQTQAGTNATAPAAGTTINVATPTATS